jgi:hypothetical protein
MASFRAVSTGRHRWTSRIWSNDDSVRQSLVSRQKRMLCKTGATMSTDRMFKVSVDYRLSTTIQASSFEDALAKFDRCNQALFDQTEVDVQAVQCEARVK